MVNVGWVGQAAALRAAQQGFDVPTKNVGEVRSAARPSNEYHFTQSVTNSVFWANIDRIPQGMFYPRDVCRPSRHVFLAKAVEQ